MQRTILFSFLAFEVLLMVALGGCGTTFDHADLRSRDIRGDGFNASLAREYRDLALYEADEMNDWPDAGGFGEKAVLAAGGQTPPPEKVADWRIPKVRVREFTVARARLVSVLTRDVERRSPSIAAIAQSRFDCWIEQQEENWQTEHIARCRDAFFEALDDLERQVAMRRDPLLAPAILDASPEPGENRAMTILFDFDSADLTEEGRDVIMDLARDLTSSGRTVRVFLAGHADRAGAEPYNKALSERRAKAVSEALIELGVSESRISVTAHGESRPKVPTADGVREPANRRVEIFAGAASDS